MKQIVTLLLLSLSVNLSAQSRWLDWQTIYEEGAILTISAQNLPLTAQVTWENACATILSFEPIVDFIGIKPG